MMTTHSFNTLAIGQHTQVLNNRLNCRFDGINATQKMKSFFLVSNEDLIDINTRVRTCIKTHCMRCFFKSGFCQSIKKRKGKQIPPISGINLKDYFLSNLASFSRQASLTHALKLPLPADKSICASKSSSKRICLVVLLERSKDFLSFLSCIGSYRYDKLNLKGSYHYICNYLKKAMPRSAGTLSRHLTTNIKRSNAMANSNDTLRPKNGQPDLSNLISVLNLYQADVPTHHLLQAENHFEELQQSILYGIGAIGNLMFWASENESYSEQNFKSDMRDIGYLLAQLRDVACFASNQINLLDATQNHKGGK
jgi:hypothetical protein